MNHIILTVRFLDDRYHGLLDRVGPPEWPPSPFRLFQALVAGVGQNGKLVVGSDTAENAKLTDIGSALGWLQKLDPPIIVTPKSRTGISITRFVLNNDGDKKFDRQERLTAKPTIPTLFLLKEHEKPEVHYIWDINRWPDPPVDQICDAARMLTSLGWGIDMAFANAVRADEAELESLCGVRWYPKIDAWRKDGMLRTPKYNAETKECTLCDLRHCHHTALSRIEHGKPLKTVDKPKVFDRILYTSTERAIPRPHAIFRLLDHNDDIYRHPHASLIHVAGMVRHAAIERMKAAGPPNWRHDEDGWLKTFVCGHRGNLMEHQQISYVPLPSIGHEHADALIRNVLLIAPLGCERDLTYVADRINGEELKPENQSRSIGVEQGSGDKETIFLDKYSPTRGKFIDACYLGTSRVWHSVTPVILDGHNKKSKSDKPEAIARATERLICKALRRAGLETPCEFTWQTFPYLKNCLSAHKYDRNGRHSGYHRPAHLKHLTAVHVRLTFTEAVSGPITIGAGRHCGFGLFSTTSDYQ